MGVLAAQRGSHGKPHPSCPAALPLIAPLGRQRDHGHPRDEQAQGEREAGPPRGAGAGGQPPGRGRAGRPWGWPEAVAAVPAALLLIATGALPWRDAWAQIVDLAPTLAFLAGVQALAQTCAATGVFRALGERIGWASGGRAGLLLRLV